MPAYIIRTCSPELERAASRAVDLRISNAHELCERRDTARSRRAVATLEEEARSIVCQHASWMEMHHIQDALNRVADGGTIGPLPDGTVIEVAPDPHEAAMRRACPLILQSDWQRMTVQERCEAFNAREAV